MESVLTEDGQQTCDGGIHTLQTDRACRQFCQSVLCVYKTIVAVPLLLLLVMM